MDQVVADASVIVKWYKDEIYSPMAYALRDSVISKKTELIEPSLLIYEVLNALRYSRPKKYTTNELREVADSIENFDFKVVHPAYLLLSQAIETATKYSISIYDAIYVALAESRKAILYTADGPLLESVKKPYTKHIKDFK